VVSQLKRRCRRCDADYRRTLAAIASANKPLTGSRAGAAGGAGGVRPIGGEHGAGGAKSVVVLGAGLVAGPAVEVGRREDESSLSPLNQLPSNGHSRRRSSCSRATAARLCTLSRASRARCVASRVVFALFIQFYLCMPARQHLASSLEYRAPWFFLRLFVRSFLLSFSFTSQI